jgi:hypothetical protein
MEKRIIYNNDDGTLAIIVPSPDCGLTIEQIALKDVPFNKPFKIIDASDLPTDRTHRDSWYVEDSELTDGVGADYGIGSDNLFSMETLNNGN